MGRSRSDRLINEKRGGAGREVVLLVWMLWKAAECIQIGAIEGGWYGGLAARLSASHGGSAGGGDAARHDPLRSTERRKEIRVDAALNIRRDVKMMR